MTTTRLAAWVAETREDLRLAREGRAEQEVRAAALHQRAATAADAMRHPELSTVDLALGHGGVDHLDVIAGAFTDADREDRAQRRQRAEVLAERRLTVVGAGRSDARRGALRLPHLVGLDRPGRGRSDGAVTGAGVKVTGRGLSGHASPRLEPCRRARAQAFLRRTDPGSARRAARTLLPGGPGGPGPTVRR